MRLGLHGAFAPPGTYDVACHRGNRVHASAFRKQHLSSASDITAFRTPVVMTRSYVPSPKGQTMPS